MQGARASEFTLTHIAPSGECLGRDASGNAICVRGAVPGDVVVPVGDAQRRQRRRDFSLLRPAPERREVPCSVQSACGGCVLMPLEREAQRRVKLAMLTATLAQGGCALPSVAWGDAPARLGYRNRIRLRIERGRIGFFNAAKRSDCSVLESELVRALQDIDCLHERARDELDGFTHCELRSPDLDARPSLTFVSKAPLAATTAALAKFRELLPYFLIGVSGDPAIACQRRRLTATLDAFVPIDAFLQVNDAVNAALIEWVTAKVCSANAHTALDLFAGAGNFSLPLAAAGLKVTAIERHAASIAALQRSACAHGFECEGLASPVESALCGALRERQFDCVIVDAPRSGAGDALATLPALGATHVVLCSCYAPGFARDLRTLQSLGYGVREIVAWDMFAETHHLESVALLARS